MALRIQRPDEGYDWLYQQRGEGYYFTTMVILGRNENYWAQCTDAQKQEWEKKTEPAEQN